jgi:hypothetical protein
MQAYSVAEETVLHVLDVPCIWSLLASFALFEKYENRKGMEHAYS